MPLCAPWFGKGQIGSVHPRTHGLVKHAEWEIVSERVTAAEIELELALAASAVAELPGFAGYEGLAYRLFVTAGQTLKLRLEFIATQEVSVDAAFHTYFSVPLPAEVQIAQATQRDYVAGTEGRFAGVFPVAGTRDSVFLDGGSEPILLRGGDRVFTITSSAPDVVVWNPGRNDERIAPGEWQQFVCVETGAVQDHALNLCAGETAEISVEIALAVS
ncbi:hypothetical protein [Arcanobacterium hippocoleae]|uniref:aldose epimerase family protein n=1 Tax=Arcanobacterium hippocoleae TaxID=149017 RepID=UPI00333E1B91